MKKILIMILAMLVFGLVPAAGMEAATFNVSVVDFAFSPATLTINAGDTVVWTLNGAALHTVTSGAPGTPDQLFNSGTLGSTPFSFTFTAPGTYPYFCQFHYASGMVGTIVVNAAAIPAPSGGHSSIFQPVVSPVIGLTMATSLPIGMGQFAVGGSTMDLTIGLGAYAVPVDLYLAISASTVPNTLLFLMPNLSLVSQTFNQVVQAFTTGTFPPNVPPWMANVSSPASATIFAGVPVSGMAAGQYGIFLLVVPHGGTLANYDLYGTSVTIP